MLPERIAKIHVMCIDLTIRAQNCSPVEPRYYVVIDFDGIIIQLKCSSDSEARG